MVRRHALPLLLVSLTAASPLVAYALGRSVWSVTVGAGLGLVYWLLDESAARLATRGSFSRALVIGLGGMVVRLIVVMAVLVAVGLGDRVRFLDCACAFLIVFTAYLCGRLVAGAVLAR